MSDLTSRNSAPALPAPLRPGANRQSELRRCLCRRHRGIADPSPNARRGLAIAGRALSAVHEDLEFGALNSKPEASEPNCRQNSISPRSHRGRAKPSSWSRWKALPKRTPRKFWAATCRRYAAWWRIRARTRGRNRNRRPHHRGRDLDRHGYRGAGREPRPSRSSASRAPIPRRVAIAKKKRPGLILADIQLADGSSGLDAVNELSARSRCRSSSSPPIRSAS